MRKFLENGQVIVHITAKEKDRQQKTPPNVQLHHRRYSITKKQVGGLNPRIVAYSNIVSIGRQRRL